MQTILGSGGSIGKELAKELLRYTKEIRLVSRNPKKINESDEVFPADLKNREQVDKAVQGSEIVYLVAGLEYKAKVWQKEWPLVMQNVIDACKKYGSRLVFFDNMYMYDKAHLNNMTEETPVKPCSKKGAVRAMIAQMILDAVQQKALTAMIVRAADFYGPGVEKSFVMETVYKNLLKGKKAMWMGDMNTAHTMTYVPDAAKATALLGNTPDAYGQVWHLPSHNQKITGRQWIELFASGMNKQPKSTTISKGMMRIVGIFNPLLRELVETMYQYESDYNFNSTKFQRRFPDFAITEPRKGVALTIGSSEVQQ
jgi:nucleoside-diphosphate-sugar epimerase